MFITHYEVTRSMHYSPDPAFAAGFVSGLGFGVGRETPMLSKTNPKPFFSVSTKLMTLLPFHFSARPSAQLAARALVVCSGWSNDSRRRRLAAVHDGDRRRRQWPVRVGQQ